MSGKKRVRHRPRQIVDKLQEADRLLRRGSRSDRFCKHWASVRRRSIADGISTAG